MGALPATAAPLFFRGRRGDGSRCFYNRTSAVVARATGVTG